MPGYFRAVAVDYDGTLTEGARPADDVLEAIAAVRAAGRRVVLVTGRILPELRGQFPDVDAHFDVVVAENGAVLHSEGVTRALTAPVPVALDEALVGRGIPFRRGLVLLACDGEHDVALLEELRRLGLDCQIARNRDQLMVLPAGVTKGSGVTDALAELGISRHSAVAIGDAENDHTLLEACELGVAVANAVPSLKEAADVVLAEPAGAGVREFLCGPLLGGELAATPRRWQVELGVAADGTAVAIPASRINLLVTGGSGSGKSYAAGFLAERLVALGYCICVFDPEGDHGPLGRLRGVVLVGNREGPPPPAQLARMLGRGMHSVVVDLSFAQRGRDRYVAESLDALAKLRDETGLPHWLLIDEAHAALGAEAPHPPRFFDPGHKGFCLVTYRPADLRADALEGIDFVLALPGEHGLEPELRDELTLSLGLPSESFAPELTGMGVGYAVLVRPGPAPDVRVFALAPRWVEHVRHGHKYAEVKLPPARRFHFRGPGGPSGAVAANLSEFHHVLRRCGESELRHHAAGRDFSRWIQDVIQDSALASGVREVEARLVEASAADVEALRGELLQMIEKRYLG
jgi:hydroxymethylpyrimidine pyrophosphatase-like HAD family hydrolase